MRSFKFAQTGKPVVAGPSYLLGESSPVPAVANVYQIDHGYEIGTNTTLFVGSQGSNEIYFLRYDIGPTSNATTPLGSKSVTGDLWLSFDLLNQDFRIHDEHLNQNVQSTSDSPVYTGSRITPSTGLTSAQSFVDGRIFVSGSPDPSSPSGKNANLNDLFDGCISCAYYAELSLSFVSLAWDGTKYNLVTSAIGNDVVLREPFGGLSAELNIAEVPLPSAYIGYLCSLAVLSGFRSRSRKRPTAR